MTMKDALRKRPIMVVGIVGLLEILLVTAMVLTPAPPSDISSGSRGVSGPQVRKPYPPVSPDEQHYLQKLTTAGVNVVGLERPMIQKGEWICGALVSGKTPAEVLAGGIVVQPWAGDEGAGITVDQRVVAGTRTPGRYQDKDVVAMIQGSRQYLCPMKGSDGVPVELVTSTDRLLAQAVTGAKTQ